jgi:hypothetical protein
MMGSLIVTKLINYSQEMLKNGKRMLELGPGECDNLVGREFGKWLVIEYDKKDLNGKHFWTCKCQGCDETYSIGHHNLVAGKTNGCRFCNGIYRKGREKTGVMKVGKR